MKKILLIAILCGFGFYGFGQETIKTIAVPKKYTETQLDSIRSHFRIRSQEQQKVQGTASPSKLSLSKADSIRISTGLTSKEYVTERLIQHEGENAPQADTIITFSPAIKVLTWDPSTAAVQTTVDSTSVRRRLVPDLQNSEGRSIIDRAIQSEADEKKVSQPKSSPQNKEQTTRNLPIRRWGKN